MNILERRKIKKLIHHLAHEARHVRHMRADIGDPDKLQALKQSEEKLRDILNRKAWDEVDAAAEGLSDRIEAVMPEHGKSHMREYVEVITVALVVAMGLRAYFVQPFKIPTGSMQPTLFGITYEPAEKAGLFDRPPLFLAKMLLTGNRFVSIKSEHTGSIQNIYQSQNDGYSVQFNNSPSQNLPPGVSLNVKPKDFVERGDVLATGIKKAGDHIFVDKIRYNFVKPKRGQIFVFDTEELQHSMIRHHTFYIKRLAGEPGDTLSIKPPYLVVNGEKMTDPYPFLRVAEEYGGYFLASYAGTGGSLLYREDQSITLGDSEYLPLGDNSASSLDGRYFGAVQQRQIVGPAFMVYWPFTARWGWTK